MRRDLDDVFARAQDAALPLEVRSDLARYACMRLTGFLEQALLSLGRAAVNNKSGGVALSFAESHLESSFNPRKDAIVKFVNRFAGDWRIDLEELLAREEHGSTINAVVGTRNQIAHGHNISISIKRLVEYRAVVDKVVDLLVEKFDPQP